MPPLKRKRTKQRYRRYQRPIPGDRVQMDTCKIAKGLYQYTAVDDCSRFLVVALYPRRTAAHTIDFVEPMVQVSDNEKWSMEAMHLASAVARNLNDRIVLGIYGRQRALPDATMFVDNQAEAFHGRIAQNAARDVHGCVVFDKHYLSLRYNM